MIYQIDSKVAQEVGFVGAILFHHICFWIKKNKANQKHFYDGEYWTYSSVKAFSEYFEDMTESQIRQGLKNLINNKYIKVGNYNKVNYDRTQWFSFDKIGKSICENSQIELRKLANRIEKISKPIPDRITDITTYIKENDIKEKKESFKAPTIEEVQAYCKEHNFTATDPTDFWEFYENKMWKVGNVKMKKWELALSRWERNNKQKGNYNGINNRNNQKDTSNNNGSCNDSNDYEGIRC